MTTPIPRARSGVAAADAFTAALDTAVGSGPVLVLADTPSISRRGPAWAQLLAARGLVHRVRLCEGPAADGAVATLVTEAVRFGATVIVAAGVDTTCHLAEAVAREMGIPCLIEPAAAV